jgi:hypothetical protein
MPSFPRPYLNDVKQDDATMHYVRGGDFTNTDIGSRKSGTPDDIKSEKMTIEHVGDGTPGPNWGPK